MTAEYAVLRENSAHLPPDIAFLNGRLALRLLDAAAEEADRLDTSAHEVLIERGAISVEAYYEALAGALGARFSPFVGLQFPADPFVGRAPGMAARLGMLVVASGSGLKIATAPRGRQVADLVETVAARPAAAQRLFVTTPRALTDALVACGQARLLDDARRGLGRLPERSSASSIDLRRFAALLGAAAALLTILTFMFPVTALLTLAGVLGVFFLAATGLRLTAALLDLVPAPAPPATRLSDRDLPAYTVLVPLYREASVIAGLVEALSRLDYPAHRLDIKLIVEADDGATRSALNRMPLPPQFEVVVVPDARPKTKPKALCFALALARGSLVTIYDAEDIPDPDQLRRAAERFAAEPEDVACLQARLAWYNWSESWFTRHLALEYASLFDVFLPALDRLGLPFPLGGTSNHFRIGALRSVGAWDAFNVTEDADLGLRLVRGGYRCKTLHSTTFEEAPVDFGPWLRQRTRWFKGWMQTYFVHMRAPGQLLRDLGLLRFSAMQAVFGGVVASAFVHPLFVAIIAVQVAAGDILIDGGGPFDATVNWIGAVNLAAGYIGGFAIALAALRHRPMWWLAPELALLPVYWLTMSIAAFRAAWQLVRAPSYWEKTEHGVSGMDPVLGRRVAQGDAGCLRGRAIGAGDRDRTDDIQLGKLTFYH